MQTLETNDLVTVNDFVQVLHLPQSNPNDLNAAGLNIYDLLFLQNSCGQLKSLVSIEFVSKWIS